MAFSLIYVPTLNLRTALIVILIIFAFSAISIIFYRNKENAILSTGSLDQDFQVKIGEKVLIREIETSITFVRVVEDTRCPVNVYCVWAGRVTVELEFREKNKTVSRVNLTIPGGEEKELKGYIVKLLKVEPEREYPEKMEIPLSDYKITLKVSRQTS